MSDKSVRLICNTLLTITLATISYLSGSISWLILLFLLWIEKGQLK